MRLRARLSPLLLFAWGCGRTLSAADGGADLAPGDGAKDQSLGDRSTSGAAYDLGAEFSFSQNPHGPWRYGFTTGAVLSLEAFQLDTSTVASAPVGFWHPADGQAGYYPYVAENSASTLMTDPTDSWAVQPGEVAMEGSAAGQYSVVQFAVPATAVYDVEADFAGVHVRLSTTDVHVMVNDLSVLDAEIDGYGGDPSFHAVEGQSPRASYRATQTLQAGDVLSFAVGVGSNGTNANDTTGLFVHITSAQ